MHGVIADAPPLTVVHCHCEDCRRVTGGAFGTFASFPVDAVRVEPVLSPVSHAKGVERRFCPSCGSALTATYDYLPGQVYVPIGVLEDADNLPPVMHCYSEHMLPWVQLNDGLPREIGSGTDTLNKAAT